MVIRCTCGAEINAERSDDREAAEIAEFKALHRCCPEAWRRDGPAPLLGTAALTQAEVGFVVDHAGS